MTLLSLSKMITAELREPLTFLSEAGACSMPSVEAFDGILPLPMWRERKEGGLCYCCPISRVLAAQYHLDMKFLAVRWWELIDAAREKARLAALSQQQSRLPAGSPRLETPIFSLGTDTQMYQDDAQLMWRIERLGGHRWLAMATAAMAQSSAWSGVGPNTSCLEGRLLSGRQRTVEREFIWQSSHASCFEISQRIQACSSAFYKGREDADLGDKERSIYVIQRGGYSDYHQTIWDGLWTVLLAQMELVDALAVSSPGWVTAVDHLSEAWAGWLRIQVLNDLHLSQMAEVAPVRNLACLTQSLLNFSIRMGFGTEAIGRL